MGGLSLRHLILQWALSCATGTWNELSTSLIAMWRFDQGDDDLAGGVFLDSGPNGWDAVEPGSSVTIDGPYGYGSALTFGSTADDDLVFPAAVTSTLVGDSERSFSILARVSSWKDGAPRCQRF